MRIGYGRVSARDQNPESQREFLEDAECNQVFVDRVGTKPGRHPELDKALMVASRPGDQLVVTRLDRLGRSLAHLSDLSNDLQTRGVHLVVLEQGIDTSTDAGQVFFEILDTITDFEHALQSERGRSWFP
jgi:DNA invertase Pin-like site-specific DNA recombinase